MFKRSDPSNVQLTAAIKLLVAVACFGLFAGMEMVSVACRLRESIITGFVLLVTILGRIDGVRSTGRGFVTPT